MLAALTWSIGLGWTLLVLLATSVLSVALAGSQVKRQIARLQRSRTNPQGAVADGMLVALGTFLVFIPGLVSTVVGALMLLPPTRSAMRPLAGVLLTRGIARRVSVVNLTAPGRMYTRRATPVTTSTAKSSTTRCTAESTRPTSSGATTSPTRFPFTLLPRGTLSDVTTLLLGGRVHSPSHPDATAMPSATGSWRGWAATMSAAPIRPMPRSSISTVRSSLLLSWTAIST